MIIILKIFVENSGYFSLLFYHFFSSGSGYFYINDSGLIESKF